MESSLSPPHEPGHPDILLLRADTLARLLSDVALDQELVLETTSTNADLMARARAAAPARPVLRVAQRQTQGRGRRGRHWHGSEAGSLLFSLALRWRLAPARSAAVTLACGLAVAQELQSGLDPGRARIRVKWPNDIVLDDGKLAGILVEMAEDASGERTLVIGLGINLAVDPALRSRVIADAAAAAAAADIAAADRRAAPAPALPPADLASVLGASTVLAERESWLARLVHALLGAAGRYEEQGFAGGPEDFAAWCAYAGCAVDVLGAGAHCTGTLRGVDEQGRLLLDTPAGLQALASGEISVRRAQPRAAGGAA